MQQHGPSSFQNLKEELVCSVCFQELEDPVSIACGHTFCRNCIAYYWDNSQQLNCLCPECQKVCPKDQLIPVYRLRNVLTKVQEGVKAKQTKKEELDSAIQFVHTDQSGQLQVDEAAIKTCLFNHEVLDYPVCLICVIGEKGRGKSCLINCILKALSCQEKGQPLSLGSGNEPARGFGITGNGIWIWRRPFILEHYGEKMAVFVLDTEDSLDSSSDSGISLSAISAALSSCLIFNVLFGLKTEELDYLEMYLNVAELVGKFFELHSLQHLDILVHDYHNENKDGQSYKRLQTEILQSQSRYRLVSETLRNSSVACCLLPHPERELLNASQGELTDTTEDFQNLLGAYIYELVGNLWRHVKTDKNGRKMSCSQLARILKTIVKSWNNEQYRCASPLQLYSAFENHKKLENIKEEFWNFIMETASEMSDLINKNVLPATLESRISIGASELQEKLKGSIEDTDGIVNQWLTDLKSYTHQQQGKFCQDYSKKFYEHKHRESKKIIKKKFNDFLLCRAAETSTLFANLTSKPSKMERKINEGVNKFLADFKNLIGNTDNQEEKRLLDEMKLYLRQQQKKFSNEYSKNYYSRRLRILMRGALGSAGVGALWIFGVSQLGAIMTAPVMAGVIGGGTFLILGKVVLRRPITNT
ncbi:RING finger protein 112-like [Xenopus laevis]|uniref:RING finger protein 112-like n=1 Tax=Xenopus laevis TaxID=8355 RepID=A0A8J1LV83_XENLA|nr:RING finger protein 112-like [Xenopus laevis]